MSDISRHIFDGSGLQSPTGAHEFGRQLHPAWQRLIDYCMQLGHGEIEKLKIQDGLPMTAEVTTRKVKFSL